MLFIRMTKKHTNKNDRKNMANRKSRPKLRIDI